jgi:predicted phage baseplate assembly protein
MPLPLPSLDRRTFDELIAEGKAMIPRLAPAWTDHNIHDPGITLIELFAWLVEMDIYRLDRITDESRRAFLRLVGIEMRSAQVAETVVVCTFPQAPAGPVVVPVGTRLTDAGANIAFATTHELHVSPANITAAFADENGSHRDVFGKNAPDGQFYEPFGPRPEPGAALYLGFDK